MSILYKFRSGTTFEALPLPGSAARLFDVKKAIVQAKKLDQGAMEFDLSVKDATTNEEYADESMLLPRGTRIVVQRLPAARGRGFLARMALQQQGGNTSAPLTSSAGNVPSNFYTIEAGHNDDEEFVRGDDEKELAALRAATETANQMTRRPMQTQQRAPASHVPIRQRPNADPELREQEAQPKKRATGIPRTFLSLTANQGEGDAPLLQPNAMGFEELKTRAGGQSENVSGSKRTLEYALKVTAESIPEYLQCAICLDLVKDAMMLPWDSEGRTTCDACIRDALAQNGFRCPLTGQEGVSPDDLLPNVALRKATEQFMKGVMEKMEEIDKQTGDDEEEDVEDANEENEKDGMFGDSDEKGVLMSKRTKSTNENKTNPDDPFGGDAFGGDVFAVAQPKKDDEKEGPEEEHLQAEETQIDDTPKKDEKSATSNGHEIVEKASAEKKEEPTPVPTREKTPIKEQLQRRLPAGYSMGPAGGAMDGPNQSAIVQEGPSSRDFDARGTKRNRTDSIDERRSLDGRGPPPPPPPPGGGYGRRGDPYAGRGGRNDSCFKCGQPGHRARDCPIGSTCYVCHQTGHIARDCPNGASGGPPPPRGGYRGGPPPGRGGNFRGGRGGRGGRY